MKLYLHPGSPAGVLLRGNSRWRAISVSLVYFPGGRELYIKPVFQVFGKSTPNVFKEGVHFCGCAQTHSRRFRHHFSNTRPHLTPTSLHTHIGFKSFKLGWTYVASDSFQKEVWTVGMEKVHGCGNSVAIALKKTTLHLKRGGT